MARKPKQPPRPLTDAELRQKAVKKFFEDPFKAPTYLQPKPTRAYAVGEEVKLGNLSNVIIQDVFDEGMAYLVSYTRKERDGDVHGYWVRWWFDLDKKVDTSNVPRLFVDYKQFPASTSDISAIFHMMSSHGLVCDPEYQRDYVWTEENKDALLDSIFEHLDIGSFLFIRHSGYLYEGKPHQEKTYRNLSGELVNVSKRDDYTIAIIDGQQRLTTIMDFILDRRPYRGVYFSQMNWHEFMNKSVVYRIIDEDQVSRKDILRMFLQSNRGVPQAPEHIAKVQAMYDQLEES